MFPFAFTRTVIRRLVSLAASLALALAAASPAHAQEPVQFGDVITEPGVYFLQGNQSGSGPGIRIQSNDVTLLLLRFTLRGDGALDNGITAQGYDRVAIIGGRVTDFRIGVLIGDAVDCTVKDTRIDSCGAAGMFLQDVDYSSFQRLRCDHNGSQGVAAINSYENRFVSILSHDNYSEGILIQNQVFGESLDYNNRVRLCWVAYNGGDGISIIDSSDNVVTQNQCVGNGESGIRLQTRADPAATAGPGVLAARDNDVNRNWCVFNRIGIRVQEDATDNTLRENIALANGDRDLVDENVAPPCANLWFLNQFLTRGGDGAACIF